LPRNCDYELRHICPLAVPHIKTGQLFERIVLEFEVEKQRVPKCVNIFSLWLKWGKLRAYLPTLKKQLTRY